MVIGRGGEGRSCRDKWGLGGLKIKLVGPREGERCCHEGFMAQGKVPILAGDGARQRSGSSSTAANKH